jgi:beta-glucanase (GH16 family)
MSYLKFDGSLAAETPTAAASNYGSSTGGETLTGSARADALWAQGAGDLLIGGGGGDSFYVQDAGARIQEITGGAANQIVSWASTKLSAYANIQNLQVGGDHTYAAGDAQNNIVMATGTSQQLYGGTGQDVLVGDGKSDTFIIIKGEGNDAIYGFNATTDVVRVTAGYTSFAQVQSHLSQSGADVKLDLGGGDAVVLRNQTLSQLTAGNFQLQLDPAKLGAQTFGDEFNSLNLWKGGSGTWATTFWYQDAAGNGGTLSSNSEQQWYVNANYAGTSAVTPWTVSGGQLTLTAAPASSTISSQIDGYKYTSGELNTYPSFAQTYGYFEMRAQLPNVAGAWPAFWLMPTDGSWPPELDVMETLTQDPNGTWTTAHSGATGEHTMSQGLAFIPNTADGFHTYGVLWTKTDLSWYVDGVEVFHTATPADMNKPMYMIANLALGGWGGTVDNSQLPAQMKVDFIHAYALADGSSTVITKLPTPTAPPPVTTPTAPAAPPASTAGLVLTSTNPGCVLTGGAGADTLNASEGLDTLTGGAGADRFVFGKEPWAPVHITDFKVGTDALDLSALFKTAGYKGADPVADHYVFLESDGNGGTLIRFDHDGTGANPVWPNTIIDLEHVATTGLTWAQLAGGGTTTPPVIAGLVLSSTTPGSVLTGGGGADTLNASQGLDTLKGGAGADHFVFGSEPWAPVHIADFQLGTDVLDLSALFKTAGYKGTDPVADHYVFFESDGNGGTVVRFDHDGTGANPVWPNTIVDLEHVSPVGLTWSQLQAGWIAS